MAKRAYVDYLGPHTCVQRPMVEHGIPSPDSLITAGLLSSLSEVPMTTPTLAAGQLADALTMVRMSRHHDTCVCCCYRRTIRIDGITVHQGGYCSPDESRWSDMVHRLIEAVRVNRF